MERVVEPAATYSGSLQVGRTSQPSEGAQDLLRSREGFVSSFGYLREPWRTWVDLTRIRARQMGCPRAERHRETAQTTLDETKDDGLSRLGGRLCPSRNLVHLLCRLDVSSIRSHSPLFSSAATACNRMRQSAGACNRSRGRALGALFSVTLGACQRCATRTTASGRHPPEPTNLDSPVRAFEASKRDASASDPVQARLIAAHAHGPVI